MLACAARRRPGARGARRRVAHREAADDARAATGPTSSRSRAVARAGAVHVVLVPPAAVARAVRVRRRVRRGDRRPVHRAARAAPAPRSAAGSATCCTSGGCARRGGARRRCGGSTTPSCASCRSRARRGSARSWRTTSTPTRGCAASATRPAARSTPCPTACAPRPRSRSSASSCCRVRSRDLLTTGCPRSARSGTGPGRRRLRRVRVGVALHRARLGVAGAGGARADRRASARCCSARSGLAQTLVVVVALPLGAFGAYRLGRRIIGLRGPALAAGLAYGINPVARNAIAQGRLGPLVLFALLPFLLLRSCGSGARGDDRGRGPGPAARGARRVARRVVPRRARAVRARRARVRASRSRSPVGADGAARVRDRGRRRARRRRAAPPVAARVRARRRRQGRARVRVPARPRLSQVLRFDTGPAAAGWAMWGLVVAAAVPLFVATGDRLAWAARGWVLALVGWAVGVGPGAVLPRHLGARARSRAHARRARARRCALGIAVSVFVDGIHTFRFGWRQPAAIVGAVAHRAARVLASPPTCSTAAGTRRRPTGRTRSPSRSRSPPRASSACCGSATRACCPSIPSCCATAPATRSRATGPATSPSSGAAPEHDADHVVDRAVEPRASGRTNRLGRMLAPMGVRYVVMPSTQGTTAGRPRRCPRALRGAMAAAARPRAAAVERGPRALREPRVRPDPGRRSRGRVPVDSARPNRAALGTDLADATPLTVGPAPPGTVLWGEAYDSEWKATATAPRCVTTRPSAGRTASGSNRAAGVIAYDAQWQRWAMLGGALVLWLLVVRRWRRTRVRRRSGAASGGAGSAVSAPSARPVDRRPRRGAFWWERV